MNVLNVLLKFTYIKWLCYVKNKTERAMRVTSLTGRKQWEETDTSVFMCVLPFARSLCGFLTAEAKCRII